MSAFTRMTLLRQPITLRPELPASTFEEFQSSELLRRAVIQKLSVIGEAAARVSSALTSRHPEVPWPQMVAFRNILVHAYFGIGWDVVWRVATNRCPVLKDQITAILAEVVEPGEPAGN